MEEYRLEMRGICKQFPGVKALDDAQLKLRPGTVHALMGENGAGKSTLVGCIFGIFRKDKGEILFEGKPIEINNPMQALKMGIAMVHQELQSIPARTVAENIFLGRYPKKKLLGFIPMVDHKKMYEDTAKILEKVKIDLDPHQKVGELSVSQRQSIEIAKAVSANCKVLILDEPTSSLTQHETEALFRVVNDLKAEGVSIVYISHKMEEILQISDEITVMRDGKYIGTWPSAGITTDFIISQMVGRELTNLFPPKTNKPGEVVFEVKNFTSINPKSFRNVSFTLRRGEILGVGGLVGAQRTELMEGLFGIRSHTAGEISYQGQKLKIRRPKNAISHGIAMLTENRKDTGIMGVLSVADNISIASLEKYLDMGIAIDAHKVDKLVRDNVTKMEIKTPSGKTLIQSLSGGNQQKVLIGRWLANDPDILILDEPTRGIDVGAKYEIYSIISELAAKGKSIIMISSEMAELIGMSDRIMVMCEGRVAGFLEGEDATQQNIMTLAMQFE